MRILAISVQVGNCAQIKNHCTLGEVPITQGIRANKAWGSGAESMGGNPYGPYRELIYLNKSIGD